MSALALVAALAAQTAAAGTDTKAAAESTGKVNLGKATYVDLEGGVGHSSNPNLLVGGDTGRGFGRASVHVVHTRLSERTTTLFSAFAQELVYTSRYGSQQSFDVNGRHDAAVNEKLRLFGDFDLAYDKGGQLDTRIIGVPTIPPLPGTLEPPILLPGGSDFLTVTGKQWRAAAHAGGSLAMGPRDSLNFSSGIEHNVFKSGAFDTRYTTIPVLLGYERQVSPRATVGARVVAQFTDYEGPNTVRVVTPELTARLQINERWSFAGGVGVSFSHVDNGVDTRNSTGLAADASLCSRSEHAQLCVHGSVDQQTATAAGPSRSINAGVDYSRQLDANQTIQFSLSGTRYSSPISFVSGEEFSRATYLRAAGEYSRRFGQRLFGGVSVAARKVTQSGPDPKADVTGSVFVRYRFGDLR